MTKKFYPKLKKKNAERQHINSDECWCQPDVVFEADNGNRVICHKGPGEELPPSSEIAQAVADAIADRDDNDQAQAR